MRINSVHAIIVFEEMQNGAIWGHFRVSYNIESSTMGFTYDFYANRWRMCSISYYFRNSSASINNVTNVNLVRDSSVV